MDRNAAPLVIDDMFDSTQLEDLSQYFRSITWKFGWGSHAAGETLVHWNKHFAGGGKSSVSSCEEELYLRPDALPIASIWRKIQSDLIPDHKLVRCYANAHTFGLDGTAHRDNIPGVGGLTTLVYCHPIWPLPWGGETLFYSDDFQNIETAIFPKPGRVAIFDGSKLHCAKSPARICRDLRITLVFKSLPGLL